MAVEGKIVQDLGYQPLQFTATAAMSPGEVVAVPDGRLGIVGGLTSIANTEQASAHVKGIADLNCLTTDTPAIGVSIYWDVSNNRATTTSSGNTFIGQAHEAKASGAARGIVLLNEGTLP